MRVQKQTKRVLYWGITLVLMILIFSFSAKNGTSSAGMSIGYAKELARILSFLGFFQIHSNADLMMHAEAVHTFVEKQHILRNMQYLDSLLIRRCHVMC